MTITPVIWLVYFFALGACVGSFLNVVVYRLPRGLSLVRPGSHCTSCQKPIAWYDNIPVLSWFLLGGRCRQCGATFSFRYAGIELLTAILFAGLFWAYFIDPVRDLPAFEKGGWMIYLGHVLLVSVMLSSSLIDAERMYFELSVIYVAAAVGLVLSSLQPYFVAPPDDKIELYWHIIPYVTAKQGAVAVGCTLGLGISWVLLKVGLLQGSYAALEAEYRLAEQEGREPEEIPVNHRREMLHELLILTPVVICAYLALRILGGQAAAAQWWQGVIVEQKWLVGLLGGVFGFMIGGVVVWATRILGTLAFGREAMGLGDVHLMAAVGAVLGWATPTIAFFIAPFLGLAWAIVRLLVSRTREIPYGPFLSMGTLAVMIGQDPIIAYFTQVMTVPDALP